MRKINVQAVNMGNVMSAPSACRGQRNDPLREVHHVDGEVVLVSTILAISSLLSSDSASTNHIDKQSLDSRREEGCLRQGCHLLVSSTIPRDFILREPSALTEVS